MSAQSKLTLLVQAMDLCKRINARACAIGWGWGDERYNYDRIWRLTQRINRRIDRRATAYAYTITFNPKDEQ